MIKGNFCAEGIILGAVTCHIVMLLCSFKGKPGKVKFLSLLKYSFTVLIQMLHLFLHYLAQRLRRFRNVC